MLVYSTGDRIDLRKAIAIIKILGLKVLKRRCFWYFKQQDKLAKSVASVMSEQFHQQLDHQQLNQLTLDAKQYPAKSRQRKRMLGEIYRIIEYSQELRNFKHSLCSEYQARDSNISKSVFEDCYADALSETTEVILKKFDDYNPGKGYILGVDWQRLCQDLQTSPESSSALAQDFREKIDCYRQTIEKSLQRQQDYQPEKSQQLRAICTNFANSIEQVVETNTYSQDTFNSLWNNFVEQVSTYDKSKNLFTWFKFILRYKFIDRKNERLNYKFVRRKGTDPETGTVKPERFLLTSESLDAPISSENQETRGDNLADKEKQSSVLQDLIEEDPDDIFTAKHLRNFPDINFREIQLLHLKNYSCVEIVAHFDNRVSINTISSSHSRSLKYFRPILEEYITTTFPLTESVIEAIRQNLEIRVSQNKKKKPSELKMPECSDINFQNIIIQRKDSFDSWKLLAEHLKVSPRELILFYLDKLQKLGLYKTVAERRQQR